jgi:predicted acylesterase/phospholipase RssA
VAVVAQRSEWFCIFKRALSVLGVLPVRAPVRRAAVLALALASAGCAALVPRDVLPETLVDEAQLAGLPGVRVWGDAPSHNIDAVVRAEAPRLKEQIASKIRSGRPVVSNLLAISGGAEDGAFGAGLLAGWTAAGTRPEFDLVTGISAGALIAPFAFLGPRWDGALGEIFTKYGQRDILAKNVVAGLLGGAAIADNAPLARLIEKYVDQAFIQEVARERRKGRLLLIGTTNLDAQRPVLWDVGRIAMSDHPQAAALFRKVLLASAAIPGVFPPTRFQVRAEGRTYEEIHVDGGVTQQVFLAPSAFAFQDFDRMLGTHVTRRLYVIRNGKVSPEWQPVEERMLAIAQRSISTLTKNQGNGDLYRIYNAAVRDGIDFKLATIPGDFVEKSEEPFDQRYMIALFERGYQMGAHGFDWLKAPPGVELARRR